MYMPNIMLKETYWEDHLNISYNNVGWHGWAMVYIPPWGWLPVDLTWWLYDPLNAIKGAAVNLEETLEYMAIKIDLMSY